MEMENNECCIQLFATNEARDEHNHKKFDTIIIYEKSVTMAISQAIGCYVNMIKYHFEETKCFTCES